MYNTACLPMSLVSPGRSLHIPCTVHNPPRIRKRLLLPQPFGPIMRRCCCVCRSDTIPIMNKFTHSRFHREAEASDQNVSVRCDNWNILKPDFIRLENLSTALQNCKNLSVCESLYKTAPTLGILLGAGAADQSFLKLSFSHIRHGIQQVRHT